MERLRNYYQKNDHLEAQVRLASRDYHDDTNKLDYNFTVDEGAKVLITAQGEKISGRELKKLVPVYQENTVDDDLLNEGRRNLRNYLQTKGYFDATVDVSRKEDPERDLVDIVYTHQSRRASQAGGHSKSPVTDISPPRQFASV